MTQTPEMRALARWENEGGHTLPSHRRGTEASLKDPVCGMTVTEESPHRYDYHGRTYFFCSARCLALFAADPVK